MNIALGILYGVILTLAAISIVVETAPSHVKPEFVECTMQVGTSQLTSKCAVTGAWHE